MVSHPNVDRSSAQSNIVRLPAAATRKVDNSRFADQRRAARAARKGNPWNAETEFDVIRAAEDRRRREAMSNLQRDPALLLVMALIGAADKKTQDKVFYTAFQAAFREPGCEASLSAYRIAARLTGRPTEYV